jgi:N-acetyl-gamma-glutamyl-phosphate reductase
MIRVGIYGATGYTGYELCKIFARHPQVELVFASSESYAGKRFSEVYPCPYDTVLVTPDDSLIGLNAVIAGTASAYTVMATMRTAGVNAGITGGMVQLRTSDAAKQWCCTAGGGAPLSSKYLPGACR